MADPILIHHETICHACRQIISGTVLLESQPHEGEFHCTCGYINKFRYWIINQPQKG